jgi:hypothetical protein
MLSSDQIEAEQRTFCREQGAQLLWTSGSSKLGVAFSTEGRRPLNGLRHPVVGDTSGWYIWFGEIFSTAPDFLSPLHTSHVYDTHPELVRLLGFAPRYRFLADGEYLDVWFDVSLLGV